MASCADAVKYVLSWEDATLSGKVTNDPGGRTRFGIAEKYHPELTNCLFYTSMGSTAALQVAIGIYERDYCDPLCIALIENQTVANKLLSLGVNCGVVTAARWLQIAVGVAGDGRIGPITLAKLDDALPAEVLASLKEQAVAHYDELIRDNASLAIYKNGWLRRAEA